MNAVLSIMLLVVSLIPAPRHYYFRYAFMHQGSLSRDEVVIPLEKGLFADSLILLGAAKNPPISDTSRAALDNRSTTFLVVIDVSEEASALRLTFDVKNLLAQRVVDRDSVRTTRTGLDSAVFEAGRRLAKELALRAKR